MMPVPGLLLAVLVGVSLGFFGGGGSTLTVPLLVYVFGLEPKQAIASSLVVVGAASFAAMLQHWRAGNVDSRTGLLFGTASMAGAYLGGRIAEWLDPVLLLLLFAGMMVLTSLAMWHGRRGSEPAVRPEPSVRRLAAQGLAVGALTGLIGAGGGFLIVPALVLWAGLSMRTAVGTSLEIITLNCAAGYAGYRAHVAVDPALVGAVSVAAVAGSLGGTPLARHVNPGSLRRAFAGFVLAMAVLVLARESKVWVHAAEAALPSSIPQLVFAVIMLGVGVAAGRVSRGDEIDRAALPGFIDGAGI